MDIKNKRIGFMFNILAAIFTAIIMNDRTGLFVSTLIIIVPFIVWFILRLLFPNFFKSKSVSYKFEFLSKQEKIFAIVNLLLIVVYTVVIIKGLCVM